MFRFTIRDVLWLTTLVAVGIVWLMDRNAIRRERAESAKREAELTSRAKMWENEANRAEKRLTDFGERTAAINYAMRMYGFSPGNLINSKNEPKYPPRSKKLILVDGDPQK